MDSRFEMCILMEEDDIATRKIHWLIEPGLMTGKFAAGVQGRAWILNERGYWQNETPSPMDMYQKPTYHWEEDEEGGCWVRDEHDANPYADQAGIEENPGSL